MSFSELEIDHIIIPDSFLRGHINGCKRLAMSMERCDTSWDIVLHTTLSIMGVFHASFEGVERQDVQKFLLQMIALISIMVNNWAVSMGSFTSNELSRDNVIAEAKRVDKMGQLLMTDLAYDAFMTHLCKHLLGELPHEWAIHLQLVANSIFAFANEVKQDDASYLGKIVAGEQSNLVQEISTRLADVMADKVFLVQATEWVKIARVMFNNLISTKSDNRSALATIISKIGFPIMEVT